MPILPVEYKTDERVVGLYRKRERFFESFARKEKQVLWELLEECY